MVFTSKMMMPALYRVAAAAAMMGALACGTDGSDVTQEVTPATEPTAAASPDAAATAAEEDVDEPSRCQDLNAAKETWLSGALKAKAKVAAGSIVESMDTISATAGGTDGAGAWFMSVRLEDGTVATWLMSNPDEEGGLYFPVGEEARQVSEVGIDAPEQATLDDDGAQESRDCVAA